MRGTRPIRSLILGSLVVLAGANFEAAAQNQDLIDSRPLRGKTEILVPPQKNGVPIRGMNGVGWGAKTGMLYAVSEFSSTMYRIDPKTGNVAIEVPFPDGEGDDVAMAPDGALAWSAVHSGQLRYRRPNGKVEVLMELKGVNPVAFSSTGRLVTAAANVPRAPLYEVDPTGKKPPRQIAIDDDEVNSFGFGPDGKLYAPAIRAGKVISIDIDTNLRKVFSEGHGRVASVKVDSKGNLISLQSRTGILSRTDAKTGAVKQIAVVPPIVDNVALGPDDTIYVSSPPDSSIIAVDPDKGVMRDIVRGNFGGLGALAITTIDGKETLVAADAMGFRYVDMKTGKVTRRPYVFEEGISTGGGTDIAFSADAIALTDVRRGTIVKLDRKTNKILWENKEIRHPYGVLFAEDGALLVSDFTGGRIVRVDEKGVTTIAERLEEPMGLAHGPKGYIYVAEFKDGNLSRVELKSGKHSRLAQSLGRIEDVAVMRGGQLAVVDSNDGLVWAVDIITGGREKLAQRLPLGSQVSEVPEKAGLPTGLAVAADGTIYVSCDADYSIRKITPPPP